MLLWETEIILYNCLDSEHVVEVQKSWKMILSNFIDISKNSTAKNGVIFSWNKTCPLYICWLSLLLLKHLPRNFC